MYWDGGMDGDTMGSMDGNADVDAESPAGEDRYVWKEFPIYYIQDSEDTSKVAEITFPQLEGIGEYWMTPYDGACFSPIRALCRTAGTSLSSCLSR